MSRRPPPPEYYEEDDFEYERERYSRPRRQAPEYPEDVEYRRRRSMPPPEDMDRLRTRDRPPRDFVQESFAPPRERDRMALRRSRDEADEDIREIERQPDELYVPSRRRRNHRPREINDDLIVEERERIQERRPRETDEELIFDEKERRRGRRPRDAEEEDFRIQERERRRERRPREIDEEELIVDSRERHRGPRRREFEEEDLIIGERERRRGPRPQPLDEEDLIMEEKETRRIRRPRRVSEGERMFDEKERRRGPRPYESEEERMVHERERRERRRHRPDRDIGEDEMLFRRMEAPEPPGPEIEGKIPPRERGLEENIDEPLARSSESRRRPRPRGTQVEEIIIDDRKRDIPAHGGRHHRDPRIDEEIIMRWKDRPSPREQEEDEEIHIRETMRHRRNPSEPIPVREPPGAFPTEDEDELRDKVVVEEMKQRSRSRTRRSPEIVEDEEIAIRKNRIVSPPREVSPEPIRAPPIHQDVITHHRHIDHGYEGPRPPRAPSPDIPSTGTSFDEVDVRHRSTKGSRKSEDDIVSRHRAEEDDGEEEDDDDGSISPTSGPSVEFSNPWDRKKSSSRRKHRSFEDDHISMAAKSANTRGQRDLPRGFEVERDIDQEVEEIEIREKRSAPMSTASLSKGIADEWSTADTPSKIDTVEMSGALSVIEVAPKHAVEEELEQDIEIGQQVEKENRDERWTEITKELVVREAIERLGYEFEETRKHYYVFSFLEQRDIDELIELSDDIRIARRRRIREMQRERASLPPPPRPRRSSLVERLPMRPPRVTGERRVREREWIIDPRRSGRF